ncbi:alpha/beta hydrolase [Sphingosinicella ginsenosidimutans]|uniref:Alpha/beta hydrolase n=1 Tax=Allosphingosinicella ginsenosidimutans TaxID=1176539 RepID=A0A5C6TQK0_9SPHN|nr:alpha/beta hydrolase [Sphingosinicella ginsenosidimutans]TXC62460.1 alpha/beta hydrolase [Sphingosinicella ginsenosidimutans]
MADWSNGYWESGDGLRLHYRDYAGPASRPPIICIPGLTRNARDFEGVAGRLAGQWRVICIDLRGRGESAYAKDPMTYVPAAYIQDIDALVRELALDRFVLIGTSLGGLITMLMAMADGSRIAGALLNDIGPVIEPRGLDHIRSYVGRPQNWPTWLHAARALRESQGDRYPDWDIDQWLVYAKRVCKLTPAGRIVLDYDMRIAEPFKLANDNAYDLWPAFRSLSGIPTTLVRGELSDLLSVETAKRMKKEVPKLALTTVPRVGHAPTLDEPESVAAIDALLARVQAG